MESEVEGGMVGVLGGNSHGGTSVSWYSEKGLEAEQLPSGEDITYHRDGDGKIIGRTVKTGMPVPPGCAYDPLTAEEEMLQREIKAAGGFNLWKKWVDNEGFFGLRKARVGSTTKAIRNRKGFITQLIASDGRILSVRRSWGAYIATNHRTGIKYWYKRNGTKLITPPFKMRLHNGARVDDIRTSITYWLDKTRRPTHYKLAGSFHRKRFYLGDFTEAGGMLISR